MFAWLNTDVDTGHLHGVAESTILSAVVLKTHSNAGNHHVDGREEYETRSVPLCACLACKVTNPVVSVTRLPSPAMMDHGKQQTCACVQSLLVLFFEAACYRLLVETYAPCHMARGGGCKMLLSS